MSSSTRCGLLSNGAPQFDSHGTLQYPLHGRIANLPAHRVVVEADAESGELAVTGVVDECRFHFHKLRLTSTLRTRPGEPGVRIIDEVTNLSGQPGRNGIDLSHELRPATIGTRRTSRRAGAAHDAARRGGRARRRPVGPIRRADNGPAKNATFSNCFRDRTIAPTRCCEMRPAIAA